MVSPRAVLAWSLGAVFFFLAFLQRVSPSVMVDELMRDFAVSAIVLGNLSACFYYTYAAVQLPVGMLIDRYGPRLILTGCALICVAGNLLFAFGDNVTMGYLARVLIGAGSAASWIGTLTLATRWLPPRHFVLLAGFGQVFGMFGAVFGQYPLSLAVDGYGWRATLFGTAVLAGVLALALWLIVRDRPLAPSASEEVKPKGPASPSIWRLVGQVARTPQTWIAAGVGLAFTGPLLAFAGLWAVPFFITAHGFSRAEAAGYASLMFIGWAVAAPLVGWLADRTGRLRTILICGGLSGCLSLYGLLFLPVWSPFQISALLLVAGASGASMILTFACARAANPPEASAAVYGFVNTAVTGSGGLLQPLIGWLLDRQWAGRIEAGVRVYEAEHYLNSLMVLPAITLAGTVAACFLRPTPAR